MKNLLHGDFPLKLYYSGNINKNVKGNCNRFLKIYLHLNVERMHHNSITTCSSVQISDVLMYI